MPENFINRPGVIKGFPTYQSQVGNGGDLGEGNQKRLSVNDAFMNIGTTDSGRPSIPVSSFYTGGSRFKTSLPFTNPEEMAAQQQSAWDKWGNGFLKMVGTATTSFLGSTVGTIYGLGSAISDQRFASFYDNPFNRGLSNLSNNMEDALPNYYKKSEQDAEWYSPDGILTANFWSDKVLKNLGYSIGAIGGGIGWGSVLKGMGITNALVRAGKGLQTVEAVENAIINTNKLGKYGAVSETLSSLSQKYLKNPIGQVLNNSERIIVSGMGAVGEASIESLQKINDFRNNLINKYIKENGINPTGQDLQDINNYSDKVGNYTWGMNVALLTATNYIQLPKILSSSRTFEKRAINAIEKEVGVLGKYSQLPSLAESIAGKSGKFVNNYLLRPASALFSPSEAFEEGMQNAIQVGVGNYFKRAYENKLDVNNFLGNLNETMGNILGEGVDITLSTKEGLESILIGGLSGGIMQAKGTIKEQGLFGTGGTKAVNTKNAIDALNQTNIAKVLQDGSNFLGIAIGSQKRRQQAIANDDTLSEKDYENDFTLAYVMPRAKYGKVDSVIQELSYYENQAMNEEGFEQLRTDGIVKENGTREDFLKRINNLKTIAKNIDQSYSIINDKYSGVVDAKGARVYSDNVIDKMVYAVSKIADYDVRIPQVNASLAQGGVVTSDILESIIKDNKPNTQATAAALNEINSLDTTSDVKDELKSNLTDVVELALRRKLFIEEYNDIKANPSRYESVQDFEFGETKEVPVTVSQDNAGKPTKKLQIGKEYSLAEPFRKEGTQLQLAPKITVLSQTLGGELEVRLPNGKTSFMTPEEFEKYTISDTNNTSQQIADILDDAIDTVLKDDKYSEIKKELAEVSKDLGDKKLDKVGWINSLDNQSIIDDVEKEFNRVTKEVFEKRDRQAKEAEQLKKNKEEIKKQQGELVLDSGTVGTNDPAKDKVSPEGKIPTASILFISGTSMSEAEGYNVDENGNVLDPKEAAIHIRNQREFLNNVGGMKNRKNMRAILITSNLVKAYGLEGLIEISYGKPLSEITDLDNVDSGFIAQVFVEQVGDKLFFVDKNGNQIGEVGVQVENINDVIFQTMRTTSLFYRDGKTPRYRKDQKEEAEAYAAAWKIERAAIFFIDPNVSPTPFAFNVSRGIAKMGDVDNHVSGVLIDEKNEAKILATDQTLIQIPTAGIIAHQSGQINVPNGRPMLVHNDNVEFLNNRKFTKKQAEGIYEAINQMATEINEQSKAGKRIIVNKKIARFLQNILYWKLGKTEAESNQINISEDGSSISLSGKTYSIPEIANNKNEIIEDLQKAFHNVNNKTLSAENFSKPFTEYYMKDGVLVNNKWKNYQTYLLSSTYPNGSARSVEDTPLSTKIIKPTPAVPTTHEQKYSTLIGIELPVGVIAKPAPPTAAPTAPSTKTTQKYDYDGETDNIFTTPFGDVIFTVKENEEPKFNQEDELFKETRGKIIKKLNDNRIKKGETVLPEEDLIPTANGAIIAYVKKELETDVVAAPIVLAAPVDEGNSVGGEVQPIAPQETETPKEPGSFDVKNVKKRGNMGFRKVGAMDRKDRMTEADFKAFKEWHAKYVPNIPFEVSENMIKINSTEKAWGVFEKGVAKFVKGGLRATEYHEIGEAIWNGMLSKEEQQALINEFRNKPGQFLDRESGKKYNYDDPSVTDNMVKERILDDFADFREGKLPARSVGEAITKFFRAILNFFKSFVQKPSLKEKLFKAIESGEFKDKQLSAESKTMPPQYRAAGQLTEEQTNAYVKDMTILASAIILGNGTIGTIDKSAIYDLRKLTSDDVFNKIEEIYTEQGIREELGDVAWKDLVVKTKQELKVLLKVDFNEDDLVNINEENLNKNDYIKETFSVDWKKTAPMGIKFASATIPKTQSTNQENTTSFKLPELKVNPKTETYSLVGYTRVFNTMLDKLKNTTSIGKAIGKIVKLANEDSDYVRMFQRLGGNLDTKTINFKDFKFEDWRFFIEFMQTYTKQKPNAIVQYISQGQVYSGSAMVTEIVEKTTRGWIQNMRSLAKEPDSYVTLDKSTGVYSISDLSGIPTNTPQGREAFLSKLGISFPVEAFNKLKGEQKKDFILAVGSIKTYLQDAKEIMNIKKKTLDVAGPYNTLAELLVNVTHPTLENTRINLEGKQSNSFSDNNVPSVFENEFNEVDTLEELLTIRPELNDVYSKGSQLLMKGGLFFDKDGKKTKLNLKVGYIEGTKNKDNNKGTISVKLNEGDRYTQEINQNLNGQYYIMIPGDGSTEWMMNMGNHVAFEDIEQGKDGWKKINKIFRGYLTDDVALALDANNREQLRNVGKKAKDLRFFKDILSEKTLSEINKMIEQNNAQADIDSFIDDNIEDVNASIKDYIDSNVEKTIDILMQNGQIEFVSKDENTGLEYYRYVMLDSEFAKKEKLDKNNLTKDDVINIITFANSNYQINNIEFHKIIFGDPYQFAITEDGKLDATKRFKSFFSPRRTTIDSPELNTFLNEDMNNAGDVQLLPEEPGYHEHKSWMDTVTVNDVIVAGSVANMQNVPEDIRKAFAKTNEGDASSIMMDGTYRELKIKNGQWNIKGVEEAWHQWQMAYTRQNLPSSVFKYSDDLRGKALEKHDVALLKTKEPNYKIEVIKPIVSGVTNGVNKINLVLDKFSQMPLYYSMVKGKNLEKLYLQMMKEKKGYIIMISGRKVGAEALHDLYTPKGEFNDAAFNNNIEVPWKAYGIQVENVYEGSGMQTRGSQITKLATLDLYQNGEPIGATSQRKEEIAAEVNRNRKILNDLHRNGYERFLKRLGIEDLGGSYKITDKRRLAKTLQDEMFRRELSDNVKDSVQLDENGEFIIPFEASPAYLQIKSILYSFIDKEITSPKMNGGSYVQAPVTLWENAKAGRKIAIKTEDGYKQITRQEFDGLSPEEQKKVVLTDDTLKFYEDADGKRYCEIMLPHWFKSKLGKHASKTDEELIKFLNTTKEGKELLSGIGFRIPTQAYSSIDAFIVKAFLPQYMGKTVIVPSEITTKSNSDFDIDKLSIYLKSIYIDKNGEIKIIKLKGTEEDTNDFYGRVFDESLENKKINKAEFFDAATILVEELDDPKNLVDRYSDKLDILFAEANTLDEQRDVLDDIMKNLEKLGDKDVQALLKEKFVEDSYRRALENEYYDSLEKLVTMPENFQRLISPVNDDGLKEIANRLDALRGYDENKIKNRLLDRNYMTSLRHAFITAKRWIGIAAVNITGHSLTQKSKTYIDPERFEYLSLADKKILKYGNGEILLDHNKLEKDGKIYISLSGRIDSVGKFISDGLSGFATSFVDVAKNPYILKIIKSDLAVGTFMFLRRVGVSKEQLVMFMNQPIINEYLTMLDNKGAKTLFNTTNISAIINKFPSKIAEKKETLGFNKDELEANIKNYYTTKDLGDVKNREQIAILNEFLKYAKMAEYSFNFGQASNYDTTKFQSGDSLQLKQWRTEAAENKNIISSIDNVLTENFIGVQAEYLDMSMDAMGEALILETPQFTNITNILLKSYEEDKFLNKDKFNKIANKIKASFLDYIIQKRSDVAINLQEQLTDDRKSVAQMLVKAKKEYPGVQILEDLEVDSSGRIGGAQTIKLKVNDKLAYTENMYTGMMRELRDNPDTNALYKGIVRLAILQGIYQSPISIKNIIPVEDYSAQITYILTGLTVDEDIRAFATSNEFQRNEWQDNDVVPIIEPRFAEEYRPESEYDLPRKFQGLFKVIGKFDGKIKKVPGPFPTIQALGVNSQKRHLLFISTKYDAKVSNYDVIKMPRAVSIDKKKANEGKIDVATGIEITNQTYAEKIKKGDTSLQNYYGYQKVKYADGSPLIARYDEDGNPVYVYKFINLHGDGMYATEYYGDGRPSVFNNGSQKNVKNVEGTLVSNEILDQDIVDFYGGEIVPQNVADPIIATIEKESETTSQPATQSSTSVKEGVSELFENNSELANSVYEAMGFEQVSQLSVKEEVSNLFKELVRIDNLPFEEVKKQGLINSQSETIEVLAKQIAEKSIIAGIVLNTEDYYNIFGDIDSARLQSKIEEYKESIRDKLINTLLKEGKIKKVDVTPFKKQDNTVYDATFYKQYTGHNWAALGTEMEYATIDNVVLGTARQVINAYTKYKNENKTSELTEGITPKQKQQAQQAYSNYLESLNKSNTNPELQGNQQEQVKKFAELQERLNNKEFLEGAKFAYESSEGGNKSLDTKNNIERLKERLPKTINLITPQDFADYGYTLKSNYADEIGTILRSFANNYISDEEFSDRLLGVLEEQKFTSDERVDKMKVNELKSLALIIKYRNLILANKENILKNILKKQSSKKFELRKVNDREDSFVIDTDYGGSGIGFNPVTNEIWENDNKSTLIVNTQQSQSLKDFGTQEQYNDYIARVSLGIVRNPSSGEFNSSAVKDIVYHRSKESKVQFEKGRNSKIGIYFSQTKEYFKGWSGPVKPYIINIINPIYTDNQVLERNTINDSQIITVEGYGFQEGDGTPSYEKYDKPQKEYVVFEPEQIHILGGKQDIEGFKKFVDKSTSVEKKELFTVEKGIAQKSFRGKPLNFVDNIDSKKETVVVMSNNRETGVIIIDQKGMEKKFNDKAWTTLAKQLDGSFATPLAENEFSSMNEWFTFALIHEVKHDTILKQESETTGQYEDRINQAALADLRENYNVTTIDLFKESRFNNIEKEIGGILIINNANLRLLEVTETTFENVKLLKLQSKSGLLSAATISYYEEDGTSIIESNPTAEDLGLEEDEYNTNDFKC